MSLLTEFKEWQKKLISLQEEGEDLYSRIEKLERQNIELRQKLTKGEFNGGFEALLDLYEEGFHICPGNFAQNREGDCIFCLNFLLHKGRR